MSDGENDKEYQEIDQRNSDAAYQYMVASTAIGLMLLVLFHFDTILITLYRLTVAVFDLGGFE